MKYLYKIFHEKSRAQFDKEYNKRMELPTTQRLGLKVKPQNQPNAFELFYVPTNKMIDLTDTIHKYARELQRTFDLLPVVAREQFILESLVEELYSTNDIEGVKSTREELARSAREVRLNKDTNVRFKNMIKSYMNLINGDVTKLKLPSNVRDIYDEMTRGEIGKSDLPDGAIFRKDPTFVLKQLGSGKVIHTGLMPESKVIEEIENLLTFMENAQLPMLIKIAIGHYFFGYVHPFYDGNGRTSRFISSVYLSEVLGDIGSLSLSRGCHHDKKEYLTSFDLTNSLKNRGEMNVFIETFLFIVCSALEGMLSDLKEKYELLQLASKKIETEPKLNDQSHHYKDMMIVIAQNYFFDSSKGITVKELAQFLQLSKTTVRKILKELLNLSLINQTGERPAYFSIDRQYFEQ
ncbi:Fic family protein [Pelagirhabdus alkalitolerans]|uniref:Fic family protein n=1 Tax=Pelagirhabdus alkalitolerans TaxID=1612202 RepID=A0A1G6GP15_9BACI|nr:Fic family protein [Pelagirhabdus alkalitolerans]SDB83688.1 Fic family protein [Pelagirhabdus alkalitolerans]